MSARSTAPWSRGYSLLEMMVTLGVLLVLMGIGASTFALVEDRSSDRDALSVLDRAVMAQRSWVARNATWADDPSVLNAGRGVVVSTSASGSPSVVSIAVDADNNLGVAVRSDSGTCFAKVVPDPLLDGEETSLELSPDVACSGVAALAAS